MTPPPTPILQATMRTKDRNLSGLDQPIAEPDTTTKQAQTRPTSPIALQSTVFVLIVINLLLISWLIWQPTAVSNARQEPAQTPHNLDAQIDRLKAENQAQITRLEDQLAAQAAQLDQLSNSLAAQQAIVDEQTARLAALAKQDSPQTVPVEEQTRPQEAQLASPPSTASPQKQPPEQATAEPVNETAVLSTESDSNSQSGEWLVNIGSFSQHDSAAAMSEKVQALGYRTNIEQATVNEKPIFRLQAIGFSSKTEANQARSALTGQFNIRGAWVDNRRVE